MMTVAVSLALQPLQPVNEIMYGGVFSDVHSIKYAKQIAAQAFIPSALGVISYCTDPLLGSLPST